MQNRNVTGCLQRLRSNGARTWSCLIRGVDKSLLLSSLKNNGIPSFDHAGEKFVGRDSQDKGKTLVNKLHGTRKLSWNDVRTFTPFLFLQNERVPPPMVARRLWAAIVNSRLNQYETELERVWCMSFLVTLAMIFQEFRGVVFPHSSLVSPDTFVTHIGITSDHIVDILNENKIKTPTRGQHLADVLILDDVNRYGVTEAIGDYFASEDEIFRLLAFPMGMSRQQQRMSLADLLGSIGESNSEAQAFELAVWPVSGHWQRGLEFIRDGFRRPECY